MAPREDWREAPKSLCSTRLGRDTPVFLLMSKLENPSPRLLFKVMGGPGSVRAMYPYEGGSLDVRAELNDLKLSEAGNFFNLADAVEGTVSGRWDLKRSY